MIATVGDQPDTAVCLDDITACPGYKDLTAHAGSTLKVLHQVYDGAHGFDDDGDTGHARIGANWMQYQIKADDVSGLAVPFICRDPNGCKTGTSDYSPEGSMLQLRT